MTILSETARRGETMDADSMKLLARADKALAADKDHLTDPNEVDLAWLVAQLACWPARVDESCTTNIRFLMTSAAASLRQLLPTPQEPPHAGE